MKLEIRRQSIIIEPQGPTDEAYIEEVFDLRREGDYIRLTRRNAIGLSCIAYLEASGPADRSRDRRVTELVETIVRLEKELATANARNAQIENLKIETAPPSKG